MPTDDTRAQILATALRLFRERGYEATTMRLIATDYQHETNRPTFRTLAD